MAFKLQYVFQKKLPKVFIKLIQRNDILKGNSVVILFCGRVLKRAFVSADQPKIADLTQHSFGIRTVGNNKPFFIL